MVKQIKIINFINVIFLILILSIFFPSLAIWGYQHEIITNSDPLLKIMITENTLFNVLNDGFYSNTLKTGYISILVLEILSIVLASLSLGFSYLSKNRRVIHVSSLISGFVNVVLASLIVTCFFSKMPLNIIGSTFLIITIVLLTLMIIFIIKNLKQKETVGDLL